MTTPVPTPGPEYAEPAPVSVAEAPAVPVVEVDDPIAEPSPLPLSEPLSAEGAALIDTGRAVDAVEVLRQAVARVRVAGEGSDLARDPAAARAHLPSSAWQVAKEALARGPVLVQVPRRGYLPSLSCQDCRRPARCRV